RWWRGRSPIPGASSPCAALSSPGKRTARRRGARAIWLRSSRRRPVDHGRPPEPTGPGAAMAAGDRYWEAMDPERTAARSVARAELALALLARAGIRGGTLLDVGCGPGFALERIARAGFTARGAEASPAAAARARARGLRVEVLDLESAPLPAGFDLVTAFEVLEHLRDPLRVLRSMAAALAPGGKLVVSLP